jgi:hypothetical protein
MWHDNIHAAIQSLHPGASLIHDYVWVMGADGEPYMQKWDTDKLGPLDLAAIEAEALRLASIVPVPATITRRQCARELFERERISGPEMVAMTATGTPPADIESMFALMPDNEQWIARSDFAADTYRRDNPLLVFIMTASGSTAADIDDFFIEAATR